MCSYTTLQFVVITTLICDRRLFFHITVLQSSVAAHMRCGEIFINFIAVKLQENLPLKKNGNSVGVSRFWNTVYWV